MLTLQEVSFPVSCDSFLQSACFGDSKQRQTSRVVGKDNCEEQDDALERVEEKRKRLEHQSVGENCVR